MDEPMNFIVTVMFGDVLAKIKLEAWYLEDLGEELEDFTVSFELNPFNARQLIADMLEDRFEIDVEDIVWSEAQAWHDVPFAEYEIL